MTGVFLPKIFDKYDCGGFAVETQYGENETPPHWHRAFEIIWMRQGSAEMFCFDKWYTLQAGQCVILPPGFLHCIRCTNPQAVKTVAGFAEACVETGSAPFVFPNTVDALMPRVQDSVSLCRVMEKLCAAQQLPDVVRIPLCRGYIFEIYAGVLSLWVGRGDVGQKHTVGQQRSTQVYRYISEHLAERLSPYGVAQQLEISYSYMARIIKEDFGSSFRELVCQMRIDLAKKLLLTTNMQITEICYATGFADASYFTKVFHASTGTTPKTYRALF